MRLSETSTQDKNAVIISETFQKIKNDLEAKHSNATDSIITMSKESSYPKSSYNTDGTGSSPRGGLDLQVKPQGYLNVVKLAKAKFLEKVNAKVKFLIMYSPIIIYI
jgi:hypothetical protein